MRTSAKGRGGWSNADTCGQREGRYEKGSFFVDVLYGRPLGLRSSACGELLVPRARSVLKQRRAFPVIWPSTWNELPLTLCLLPRTMCLHSASEIGLNPEIRI